MPLICYVPAQVHDSMQQPLSADRLLRLLGASGKLAGFRYAVYMIEQVRDHPEKIQLVTKNLYMQAAILFDTTPNNVERNVRTLIHACWRYPDNTSRLGTHIAYRNSPQPGTQFSIAILEKRIVFNTLLRTDNPA